MRSRRRSKRGEDSKRLKRRDTDLLPENRGKPGPLPTKREMSKTKRLIRSKRKKE